jgi:hypothetical protein
MMRALYAVLSEIVHLFVDDGSLALALIAWCACIGVAVAVLPEAARLWGPLFVVGCATVLVSNVVRTGRRRAESKERAYYTSPC